MIITRTPFRISFAGGGSDIASFYKKHGGCVLSATINKYTYVSIHPSFDKHKVVLKYSKVEIAEKPELIQHTYLKQVLTNMGIWGVEIVNTSDVPVGTGLGSSSSFIVGLIHALHRYKRNNISKEHLAQEACETEINQLGNPIGKQDQYAASYGGLNFYSFHHDGSVSVEPVILNANIMKSIEMNLLMFYTGKFHSASEILREQGKNIITGEKEKNQLEICALARYLRREIEKENIDAVGEVLHENWMLKKTLASGISSPFIDEVYDKAIQNGAIGGKLLGAGGGGFLLFYVPVDKQETVESAIRLPKMSITFDMIGSTVIYDSNICM